MPQFAPLIREATELHGGNPDNLTYPIFRMLVLRWDGTSFKYEPNSGGVLSISVNKATAPSRSFTIETAQIIMENTPPPGGDNNIRDSSDDRGFSVSFGDFVTIWLGYRGGAIPLVFSGFVGSVNASFRQRTLTIDCIDIKNALLNSSDLDSQNPYQIDLNQTNFDVDGRKDISDWILDIIDTVNDTWLKMSQDGSISPVRIRRPKSLPKTRIIVDGSDLQFPRSPLELLEELSYRGRFFFNIVNANIPQDWDVGFSDSDRVELLADLSFIFEQKSYLEDTYIFEEGKTLLDVEFLRGFGRANVITVVSEYDAGVSAVFPDIEKLPTLSNITTQGLQHRQIIVPVTTVEQAREVARAQWKILGDHQEFRILTIGNPFVKIYSWATLVTNFYRTDSIYAVEEVTHNYSSSGFTTSMKVVGYLYDDDGNIFQTPEEIIQEVQSRKAEVSQQSDDLGEQGQPADGGDISANSQ